MQLLGLCPLLAVTSTATNALGLGLATTLVLTLTNFSISVLRRWTPSEIRIPIYVMIIASVVSVVQMLINAYAFGLYQSLGIFIPLIVTNCIVVGRAEAFAVKTIRPYPRWMGFPSAWARLPPCSSSALCVKFWATVRSSTVRTRCLAAGRSRCVLRCSIRTPRSCWPCYLGAFIGLGMMLALKYLIDENVNAAPLNAAYRKGSPRKQYE